MLKNFKNTAISKNSLISLVFILLLFTSFGMIFEDSYAADVNGSGDDIGIGLDVEDKLENSHTESLSTNAMENELNINTNQSGPVTAGNSHTVTGGSFKKLQNAIDSSDNGDTLKLDGDFYSIGEEIVLNKTLILTSSGAVLNGKDLSRILQITSKATGSVIKGITFINGNCEGLGAGIYINAKNVTVDNCRFENNEVFGSAGAVSTAYSPTKSENTIIKNSYFKNNHATTGAGALGAYSNRSQILNCEFDSNYVQRDNDTYGGAIQTGIDTYECVELVKNCKFTNNWVKSNTDDHIGHGGAGCVRTGTSYVGCTFINNTAQHGGALTFHGVGVVDNCLFERNTATDMYGGAISIDLLHRSMELEVTNSIFNGNKAPLGGAIMLHGMNINIDNCTFNKNHAYIDGGAINIEAETVNVEDSKFTLNTADNDGGALYLVGKNTYVKNSEFKNNSAIPDSNKLDDGLGGAIYINSTQATITGNLFNYNTARNGSAVYYDKNGRQLTLTSNTLFQNQAWVYALPIYAQDIYYGETEKIGSVIHGGNNIAKYNRLDVSNAIYNAAPYSNIKVDRETPVSGARNTGELYQDDREYNMDILLTVKHEDGSVVYNKTLKSSYLGEVSDNLDNLKPGKYYVTATHFEDTYYKGITNRTTFIVKPKVDNAILKAVTPKAEYNYREMVVWTLNITNNGPNDSTGVVVRDVLPQGLTWVRDDTNGKYDPKTGELNIGSLKVGQKLSVNIVTAIAKTGEIVNRANVSSNDYDIDMTNNNAEAKITVNSATDLQVTKTAGNKNPNFGDVVEWVVTVKNNGPDTAHDVNVNDILPKSLIYISSNGGYDAKSGKWNIGTLNVGQTAKLTIKTRVNATGEIKNDVSVTGREHDYNLANNNDSDSIKVNRSCDLSIVKVANVTTANYGNLVKWTLTVTNNGPNSATGVVVSDDLPQGFVYVSSKTPRGSYSNGKFNIGNLNVGETLSLEIVSRVNATGEFTNTASIKGNEYDHDLTNNRDDAKVKINASSNLEVKKTVNNTKPNFGDVVEWVVTVKNNGPDTAHDVNVTDKLPKSLIYIGSNGNYDANSGIWKVGTLNMGQTVKLTIKTRVNTTGQIKNQASVTGREYDYNASDDNDSQSINVKKSADLSIVKVANVSVANFGDLVSWALKITNNGPDAATGVVVSDLLPEGFVYVSSKTPRGSYSNGKFSIGNLNVGETLSLEIVSRVNATGEFTNTASIKCNEYDYDMTNNRDNAKVKINPASNLEVVKTVNNTNPNYHDLVEWTITVKNKGPDTAHNIKITDLLPKGLININTSGNYNKTTGEWTINSLDNQKTVIVKMITRINQTGVINNNVSVKSDEYDYDISNNKNNRSIIVNDSVDVSIVKSVNNTKPNYLDTVKWTLTITNVGPDKATEVYINEKLPDGLVLIDAIASKGFYDDGVWFGCCLEKGEIETLELICTVNKTGNITNFVSISSKEYDHNPGNNNNSKTITVPPSVDLEVIKDVDEENPYFGHEINWMISLINHGPDTATNVVLEDILPDGLVYDSYSSTKGEYVDGKWYVGDLASGKTEYINITCLTNALGVIVNEAAVNSSEYDWNRFNNYDDGFVDVVPHADLSIEKIVDDANPNYGDEISWTLIVTNNGPNDATDVKVYDELPKSVEFIESSDNKYADGIWHIGNMKVGETKELEIICKVIKTGATLNYANVYGNEHDLYLFNNYDESSIDVPSASDLAITKSVSKYYYNVGDVLTYAIELVNNGPDTAENIVVDEIMDEGLKLKSFRASAGDFDKVAHKWTIDSLDAGKTAKLYLEVVAEMEGVFNNAVSVVSDTYDYDLTNNDDQVNVEVTEKVDEPDIPSKNNSPKNIHQTGENIDSIVYNNVTGNPFVVLIISMVFSVVFLRSGRYSKKR